MIELFPNDYNLIEHLFSDRKQYIPALSVINRTFPGRVFVNKVNDPEIAVVWATSRWMYLEGSPRSEGDKEELIIFIKNVVIPFCNQIKVNWFEIYTDDAGCWDELFMKECSFLEVDKHYESVYTLDSDKFYNYNHTKLTLIDDLTIHYNEFEILPKAYQDFPHVKEEFKTSTCLGVELRKDKNTVTVCRNNGFIYMDEYFIDIDTFDEQQRNKGYATYAASLLIDYLLRNRKFPLWETTHQNTASHKLALKLGFEAKENYPVYAFKIK